MTFFPKSWQFIEAVEAAEGQEDLAQALVRLAEDFGFSSVFGGLIPDAHTTESSAAVGPLTMVQHVPDEWGQRYNDRNYLFRDPVLHRLRTDLEPFTWSESYASCPEADDAHIIGGEAAEFGLNDGIVLPVGTLDTSRAAVSFGGRDPTLRPEDVTALGFAASFAIGHFLRLRAPRMSDAMAVTAREYDCLLWAGEGKTDWEISVILGISRSTVTKHIAAAREKLGAVNKTHAVVLAMRMRMLP